MGNIDAISNIDLTANLTWAISCTLSECPECSFVRSDFDGPPCPNCGAREDVGNVFPRGTCVRRLEVVARHYVAASSDVKAAKAELLSQIRGLGITCDHSWAEAEVRKLQAMYGTYLKSRKGYTEYLEELGKRTSLKKPGLTRLFCILSNYKDTSPQHSDVVTSSASLFEELLREFLVQLLTARGESYAKARKDVPRPRHAREMLFNKLTGVSLGKAVSEYGVSNLYESWQQLAERRNEYLHGTAWAVSANAAERAFNAAKVAFGLFAFLHNRFCVVAGRRCDPHSPVGANGSS